MEDKKYFRRQAKILNNTVGKFCTQKIYRSSVNYVFKHSNIFNIVVIPRYDIPSQKCSLIFNYWADYGFSITEGVDCLDILDITDEEIIMFSFNHNESQVEVLRYFVDNFRKHKPSLGE